MTTPTMTEGRAIVAGGSIAGLLTARALAEHYGEVLLVDRDELPDAPLARKSAPHARHAHALLARGIAIMESLFPGLERDLTALGAFRGRTLNFSIAGYHRDSRLAPAGLMVSRPLLESEIRRRVRALPNVRCLPHRTVVAPAFSRDRTRIIGARLKCDHDDEMVPADLLVDATGRGSRASAWLEAAGYPAPETEAVEVRVGYSTRIYRRQPGDLRGAAGITVAPTRENARACGIFAQEGQRWIVSLAGYNGDYPPRDEPGFLDFAESLPVPDVYRLLRTAPPLGGIIAHRFSANLRRRYERLPRFPEGFLVIGDAVCSFTPIYGQGMTVAALEVDSLRSCIAEGTRELAPRFFRRAASIVDAAWSLAAGNDRRVTGAPRAAADRAIGWYMDRFQVAACRCPEVAAAFKRVTHMLETPGSLLRPGTAIRVLRENLRLTVGRRTQALEQPGLSAGRQFQSPSNIPANSTELR
jgi:2-polyprenyl-6-methoxyphenol hydroxylase-like FAD-dependent oxidoreductase